MEIPFPSCRNIYLPLGNHISVFYLAQQDEKDLADLHLCNARRDWRYHGNVSFRARHDCSQRRGVRAGVFRAEDKKLSLQPQRAAS
jgi:hypothetical protein